MESILQTEQTEQGMLVIVKENDGETLVMGQATYEARYAEGEPVFAMREDGYLFRDSGRDVESFLGAMGREDWRRLAAEGRLVTYSGRIDKEA